MNSHTTECPTTLVPPTQRQEGAPVVLTKKKYTEFELGKAFLQRSVVQNVSPFCPNLQLMDCQNFHAAWKPWKLKDLEMKSMQGIATTQQPCCAGVNSLAPTVSSVPRIHRICSWLYRIASENLPKPLIFLSSHDFKILLAVSACKI